MWRSLTVAGAMMMAVAGSVTVASASQEEIQITESPESATVIIINSDAPEPQDGLFDGYYNDPALTATVMHDEGEDTEGKALVMLVILNRIQSSSFPDSVESVIYQKHQFQPISDGRFDRVEPSADCWEALRMVQSGWNGSQGATYFEASGNGWHARNLD